MIEENNSVQYAANITSNDSSVKLQMEHFNGPLINDCTSPQYKKVQTQHYCLDISKPADRFVELQNNIIVEIKNFAFSKNSLCIIGCKYTKRNNFYSKPCSSSLFDIQYIKNENNSLEVWNINFIKRKLVVLPHEHYLVSFPLLHM